MSTSDLILVALFKTGQLKVCPVSGGILRREHKTGQLVPARLYPDRDGYPRLVLKRQGRCLTFFAHRAVWVALHGPTRLEIDHLNHVRDDYHPSNLDPVTRRENLDRRDMDAYYSRFEDGPPPATTRCLSR